MKLENVENILGYRFDDKNILLRAISHTSKLPKRRARVNFEKMEFLGDRVLGLCVATLMYQNLKKEDEADFARRLANITSTESLIDTANKYGLIENFDFKASEDSFTKKHNSAIADMMEAVFAAVYLDGGLCCAMNVISKLFSRKLSQAYVKEKDKKSELQEYAQKELKSSPIYTVKDISGPAHKPHFVVYVRVNDYKTEGAGNSKKEAEQEAAKNMLILLKKI